jgi:hypothetical protein
MISFKFKLPGILLLSTGFILTAIYFLHRVDLSIPVFALQSSYLETHYFTIINNNFYDELIFLSFFSGFLFTAFSKEKNELDEYQQFRAQAWQKAVLLNTFMLIFFIVFIFGAGFMAMLIINLFSCFVFYHIIFLSKKRKLLKSKALKN